MKQLTQSQIEQLFDLVKGHAIKYHDVQVEIVDHYASAIEEIWQTEPNLSFFHAKNRVYREFWNFTQIETEKRTVITKRCYSEILTNFKSWLKLPKLVLTLLVILNFYFLYAQTEVIQKYMMVGIFIAGMTMSFYLLWRYYQIKNRFKKEFLQLESVLAVNSFSIILAILPVQWFFEFKEWSHFYDLPFAIYTSVWGIINILAYQLFEDNVKKIKANHLNFSK